MSVARLHDVKRAQKDQGKCGHCGVELPKGSPYRWFTVGFRSHYKQKRCMDTKCYPRPSERESSQFANVLGAQEAFEDNIDTLDNAQDIEAAVEEVAQAVEELKDDYDTALEGWENGNSMLEELRDHYESQHEEIANWTFDGNDAPELCDEHDEAGEPGEDCEECEDLKQQWLDEMREAAREVVNNVEQM